MIKLASPCEATKRLMNLVGELKQAKVELALTTHATCTSGNSEQSEIDDLESEFDMLGKYIKALEARIGKILEQQQKDFY